MEVFRVFTLFLYGSQSGCTGTNDLPDYSLITWLLAVGMHRCFVKIKSQKEFDFFKF